MTLDESLTVERWLVADLETAGNTLLYSHDLSIVLIIVG